MTGRRSHGRLSALNGVVHQGKLLVDDVLISVILAIDMSVLLVRSHVTEHISGN